MDRRLFLLSTAAASVPLYAGPLVTFTKAEADLIDAVADVIVPPDDAPGASAAGVVYYIDKQLAGALIRFRPNYTSGIPRFEQVCRESTGHRFVELGQKARTAFVEQVEKHAEWKLNNFFALVTEHTMQGFYGSPEHGGNRGDASWKMLGIEGVMRGHKH